MLSLDPADVEFWKAVLLASVPGLVVSVSPVLIAWWNRRREDLKAQADNTKTITSTALEAAGQAAEEWQKIASEVRAELAQVRAELAQSRSENAGMRLRQEAIEGRVNTLTIENENLKRGAAYIATQVEPDYPQAVRNMWLIISGQPIDNGVRK